MVVTCVIKVAGAPTFILNENVPTSFPPAPDTVKAPGSRNGLGFDESAPPNKPRYGELESGRIKGWLPFGPWTMIAAPASRNDDPATDGSCPPSRPPRSMLL